jgi:hypothetical protein
MATDLTLDQVGQALTALGNYRVLAAQEAAAQGDPDGISGSLLLALGLRETGLRNIEGNNGSDKGCFQINKIYNSTWLRNQPGCVNGTWAPVSGHTAYDAGYVPRYTPACYEAISIVRDGQEYALSQHIGTAVTDPVVVRFAIAAYNCGGYDALLGYRAGNVDQYTTGGDYSAWVLHHRSLINEWLAQHPNWQFH